MNIDHEIQELKQKIAELEERKRVGSYVMNYSYANHRIDPDHQVILSYDDEILGIIVNEYAVRSYLANKDTQNA